MAWIKIVGEDEAEGELRGIYDEVRERRGSIASVYRIHSLHPSTMKAHMDLYLTLMYGKSPLTRAQREMIAVAVSSANECPYCVTHHSEALAVYAKDGSMREAVAADHRHEGISEKEWAMLRYVRKLTGDLPSVTEGDVRALRTSGWTDAEILDINLIASYFNFVNRIVSGLGVDLESVQSRRYKY